MKNRYLYSLFAFAAVGLLFPSAGLSQGTEDIKALKKELQELRSGQRQLLKELGELKTLLRSRGQAAQKRSAPIQDVNVAFDIKGQPFKGSATAKVTLIEFSDYECPFCARHVAQTMPNLEKDYINTGKVKYVFMDFPLERIHRRAFKAHEAANCAGDQGKYWEIHDKLFANRRAIDPGSLVRYAKRAGLDMTKFKECFEGGKYAAEIRKDLAAGQTAGVSGTPSFFLAVDGADGAKVKAVKMIRGAHPYATFKAALDELLAKKN